MAVVAPVFKYGHKDHICNYRSVSLLCSFSKVIQKSVYNYVYPIIRPSISPHQHGFTDRGSTRTNLIEYYNHIASMLDSGNQFDSIYLDYSKAHGEGKTWFCNYLYYRKQKVVVSGHISSVMNVVAGVPQVSILGPLLFLLYVNDIPHNSNSTLSMYSDDTKIGRLINTGHDCLT